MQKTRSIFVKVLVLVCALCCSLAFVFGLTGCSDDNDSNAITSAVTKVELLEGDVVKVTYSDGSTKEFANTVNATCEHNLKKYWVSQANCVAADEFLMVCDKGCGYADIEYGELNANLHVVDVNNPDDKYVEEVLPTCTTTGKIKITCECGKVLLENDSVAALGHTYERENPTGIVQPTCEVNGYKECLDCGNVEEASEENGLLATGHDDEYVWVVVEDEDSNICEDGAHEINVCWTCFTNCPECEDAIAATREIAAEGHAWTEDWTVVAPTVDAAGSFSGFCEVCGTNATIVLPALNNEDYNVSETKTASCDAKGEDQYVFVYFGEEIAKCTFTVATEAAHIDANGRAINKNELYAADYVETHGDIEVDSVVTCLDQAQGALYCKNCNGLVIVNVIGDHIRGEEITDKYVAPTCTETGMKYYECTREGCTHEDTEIIPMIDHDYEVTVDEANKKLIFVCSACSDTRSADMYAYGYDQTPATCYEDGSEQFWYQEEEGGEKKTLPAKTIAAYGHYYGNTANKLVKDKEYTYSELVAIFGAENIGATKGYACVTEVDQTNNCTVSAQATAYCTECNGLVIFYALGDHDWTVSNTVEPTCTADGYITYVCDNDANHTKEEANGVKLGHNLVIDTENSILTGDNATIVFVCDRADCDYTETVNGTITLNDDKESTCVTHGYHYIEYTYKDAVTGADVNASKYLIEKKPLSNVHSYNGTKMDKASYTYSELVDIFGAENIGNKEGYALVTEVDNAFDCQNSADAVYYCTVEGCGGMKIITATGDHDWKDWTEVPATCTAASYKYRECKVEGCTGYELDKTYEPIEATGHDYEYTLPTVAQLLEGDVEMKVTCADCDYEFVITLKQFNDTDYNKVVVTDNSCANEGLTTYTITLKDGEVAIETVTFSVTTPVVEHEGAEPPVEKTWEHDGYTYTGYYCEDCGKMIVTGKTEIVAE